MSDDKQRGRGRSSYNNEPGTSSGKRSRDESSNGQDNNKRKPTENNKRAPKRRNELIPIINTRPHEGETSHRGGERIKIETNYFPLRSRLSNNEWPIYKYHVTFEPECSMRRLQIFLISVHRAAIGGFLFDGAQLFTTRKLHGENNTVEFRSETRDNQVFTIKILFTRLVVMNEHESLQVLNLILRRNLKGLDLKLVGRNFYDANTNAVVSLPQFRIQLWPGYDTSVRYHQGGILLNCDIAHKVMRTDTVHTMMMDLRRSNPRDFDRDFRQKVLGITVLTGYNNKTYRIDDVNFDITPQSKFRKRNEVEITLSQYYAEKYGIEIRDNRQPILISQPRAREVRGGVSNAIWLIPELCRITGLDERQRNDISLKMAMRPYSQMAPRTRRQRLMDFNQRIQSSDENRRIVDEWGLELDRHIVEVDAHQLPPVKLYFGENVMLNLGDPARRIGRASWDPECGRASHKLCQPVVLSRFLVTCPHSMQREMEDHIKRLRTLSRAMNFEVREPQWHCYPNDREMVNNIDGLAQKNPRLILFGTTTNSRRNADLYASIKKKCFSDYAVPSQVVTNHVLNQKNRLDSVLTKLAIQMCTKLGGAPWKVRGPPNSISIGFDVVRDTSNRNVSYGCLVATLDINDVSFFSAVSRIEGTDCIGELIQNVTKALNAYEKKHNQLPTYIFFYRGGVSEGDLIYVRDIELNQLKVALERRWQSQAPDMPKMPKMAYIIVSKRVNTRFWLRDGNDIRNPESGTVVDTTVTLAERYEFFLVSQKCGQGTISPTNYNVLYDTTEYAPQRIQNWTYIQTHMYYNWCGTTRIPAVLQYANKLGFLISNYMHRVPNPELCDQLYFL